MLPQRAHLQLQRQLARDDGICLKDSYGLGFARSTDNVTITNCYVTGGFEEGTMLDGTYKRFARGPRKFRATGRIKFGTECNGGFRNITISNCVFEDCRGIALESVDGAILEDVAITNITMRDIVDVPFFLRLGSRMRGPEGTPVGELRRVLISNVVVSNCDSRQATLITGIPGHYIEDVRLSNILVLHRGGGTKEDAAIQPPELENVYPDPNRFGPMPAHGFYIRHVNGIEIKDVEIRPMQPDMRPGFVLEDVNGAELIHVKLPQTPEISSVVLKNVRGLQRDAEQAAGGYASRRRGAEDAVMWDGRRRPPSYEFDFRCTPPGESFQEKSCGKSTR